MSTRNITGMNPARRANAAVAESAIARAEELAAQARRIREQRDQDVQNAQIAARALEQEANDQLAVIGEEVGQVAYIVNGDVEPAPAAPEPPVAPPAQPEPEQVDQPQEPLAQPDAPTAVLPQPEPQEEIGLPVAQEVHQRPHQLDPRGWNWRRWWWLIALLTLVGLLIAAWLWDWFAQGWYFGAGPTVGWILSILHWAFWPALGFFTGGYISHRLEERRERRLNQTPPPEVPAAPPAA